MEWQREFFEMVLVLSGSISSISEFCLFDLNELEPYHPLYCVTKTCAIFTLDTLSEFFKVAYIDTVPDEVGVDAILERERRFSFSCRNLFHTDRQAL